MRKVRTKVQLVIFISFFIVPIFDIFRLDLLHQVFFLFRKAFPFETGFLYLVAVLLIIIFFVTISKLWKQKFCRSMCPHNSIITFLYKTFSHSFFRTRPRIKKISMFSLALFTSLMAAYGLLAYFVNPTDLFYTISEFRFFSVVGTTFLFLVIVFFSLIHFLKQRFCSYACPYGHIQKLFVDTQNKESLSTRSINVLLIVLFLTLFFTLITLSVSTKQFTFTAKEGVTGIIINEEKVYSYELEIRNLSRNDHTFIFDVITPSHWHLSLADEIVVRGGEIKKSSLMIKVPKEDFENFHLISIELWNVSTSKRSQKHIAIHS